MYRDIKAHLYFEKRFEHGICMFLRVDPLRPSVMSGPNIDIPMVDATGPPRLRTTVYGLKLPKV